MNLLFGIKSIWGSLRNGNPVIIMEGSGGIADVIASARRMNANSTTNIDSENLLSGAIIFCNCLLNAAFIIGFDFNRM